MSKASDSAWVGPRGQELVSGAGVGMGGTTEGEGMAEVVADTLTEFSPWGRSVTHCLASLLCEVSGNSRKTLCVEWGLALA